MTTPEDLIKSQPLAEGQLMDAPLLAERLRVPLTTVYHWNGTGIGPPYFRIGKHIRYRKADVEAWLRSHRIEPVASSMEAS